MQQPFTFEVEKTVISIIQGDITQQDTDAVVNAANPGLMGGGGVDGAIHEQGGPLILEECKQIRSTMWPDGLATGKAVITSGGDLKARYVIHTVGPIWMGGEQGESELLRDAYINSLHLATEKGLKSISFPSISTGAYGYPIRKAVKVVLGTLNEYLTKGTMLKEVRLILFRQSDHELYVQNANDYLKSTQRLHF